MTARPLIPNEALPVGTRLGGCTIDSVLAEDEFGFVYRITDSLLLGKVAIKEYFPRALCQRVGQDMRPRSEHDEAAVATGWHAFVEEARLLSRLQHPALLRALDSFEAHGTVYQVMPLYAGCTLAQARQRRAEPPDAAWLRELMLTLLDPLEALHGQGLLHGDIHPNKVMLLESGSLMLLGFGTVRRALGAPADAAYAPVEQMAVGGHLPRGAWTDLYSLGAVTWFAATGRTPVRSTERRVGAPFDAGATLAATLAASPPRDQRDRTQLAAAVARAMAVLPADRLQSGAELRAVFTAPAATPQAAAAAPDDVVVAEPANVRREPAFTEPPPSAAVAREPALPAWHASADDSLAVTPPRRARGRRRLALGVWGFVLVAGAVAGAAAWRWNEVVSAGRALVLPAPAAPVTSQQEVAALEPPPVAQTAPPQAVPPEPAARTPAEAAPAPAVPPQAMAESSGAPPGVAGSGTAAPERAAAPREEFIDVKPARRSVPPASRTPPPRPAVTSADAAVQSAPVSPRALCGSRANFSLYYCMQTQCRKPQFGSHPQCRELARTGEVS